MADISRLEQQANLIMNNVSGWEQKEPQERLGTHAHQKKEVRRSELVYGA